jgi:hypothetical protein
VNRTFVGKYEIVQESVGTLVVLVHDRSPPRLATNSVDFTGLALAAAEVIRGLSPNPPADLPPQLVGQTLPEEK